MSTITDDKQVIWTSRIVILFPITYCTYCNITRIFGTFAFVPSPSLAFNAVQLYTKRTLCLIVTSVCKTVASQSVSNTTVR